MVASAGRIGRIIGVAILAASILWSGLFTYAQSVRYPDHDELQHMHEAWLSLNGQRMFADYHAHHPTLLHEIVKLLVPSDRSEVFPLIDVMGFAQRGRLLFGGIALAAVLAAAVIASRLARNIVAGIVAAALLLGSRWTWERMNEIRPDVLGVGFFWLAVPLIVGRRRPDERRGAVLLGVGGGLLLCSVIACPKWPFMVLALGALWAGQVWRSWRARRVLGGIAIAVAASLGALALLASLRECTVAELWVFVVRFNGALARWFARSPELADPDLFIPFSYCPAVFKGLLPIIACAILVLPLLWRRAAEVLGIERRSAAIVLAFVAAALAELRWIFAYPRLWPQYYLMLSFALAIAIGLAVCAIITAAARLLRRRPELVRGAVGGAAIVLAIGYQSAFISSWDEGRHMALERWKMLSVMQQNLRPGDRVWMTADMHPIGVPDASYYWCTYIDVVPAALGFSTEAPGHLPAISDRDLPPCRMLAAAAPEVRYMVLSPWLLRNLPAAARCAVELISRKLVCPAPILGVWEPRERHDGPCLSPEEMWHLPAGLH